MSEPAPSPSPHPVATAAEVEAARHDTKLAQVLYHDWEAQTYDAKWSISFDNRCIAFARDRFAHLAGTAGWPYASALEVGAGTGFFSLNLRQAGVVDAVTVTDLSPGMVAAAQQNARGLGFEVDGRVADAEHLPFADDTFDLVVGHAVVHHLPDVEQAFREMLRVLKPGGRVVVAGEPTTVGHRYARRLGRLTWAATTRVTHLEPLRDRWSRPRAELDESSRAAALEAVVDLHTFDPDDLARTVLRAGGVDVRTATQELTAAFLGWPVRTFEAAVNPERLGWGWARFAYGGWLRLSALDRVLARVVPAAWFYDVGVTALKP